MGNRIIKESICTSADIEAMGPVVEVFYYRLLVNCDDYGRMDGRPAMLLSRLFPLRRGMDEGEAVAALDVLEGLGCVQRYVVDGRAYVRVMKWAEHQRVRTQREKYPAPAGEGAFLAEDSDEIAQCEGAESEGVEVAGDVAVADGAAGDAGGGLAAVKALAVEVGLGFAEGERLKAKGMVAQYGVAWVMEAIAVAGRMERKNWGYVLGVLRNWKRDGGPGRGGGKEKVVNAQRYTQRTYEAGELARLIEVV